MLEVDCTYKTSNAVVNGEFVRISVPPDGIWRPDKNQMKRTRQGLDEEGLVRTSH